MNSFLLDILAFGAILSSVLVITAKNPVIAVLFLISVFINAAGYLILLGVGFIGISYIIVYIGAITVLFLFVIMMINIKLVDILEVGSAYTKNLPLALAVATLFIYEIYSILPFTNPGSQNISIFSPSGLSSFGLDILNSLNQLVLGCEAANNISPASLRASVVNTSFQPGIADTSFTNFLQIEMLGQGLYTYGALWLILSSVILLLAMIAPIVLSRKSV